jgi:acetoin utilization deacetylase AcuC-like enzyme
MTGLVADPIARAHDPGPGHPESPERFDAVMNALDDAGLMEKLLRIPSRDATVAELNYCHTSDYLSLAEHDILKGSPELATGDTAVCERSWAAALRASGSVLSAVDAVMENRVSRAFCVVRPPGHHATRNRGMGFCVVNNIAIAARYAQCRHGIGHVLIVDWDVHHGNGSQDIFYEDDTVLFFSTHQAPWYPGTGSAAETGAGKGKGATLNCPLPAGSGRAEILEAFEKKLIPALVKFRPEFVFISAGFDSRIHDPLGGFKLHDEDFVELTQLMAGVANEYAQGRLVSVLEGGYNLSGLGSAVVAHVGALIDY